jgi:hypothetical protein
MPKRHNFFQDLIAAIHQQLASPCLVVESEMLRDARTGQEREVDLVIRSSVGGYEVVLAVECTDRKKPVDVEWVEQIWSKHSDLPTNKLILVSRSGYTSTALEKARLFGIDALRLDAARRVNWAKYVDQHSKLWLLAVRTVAVMVVDSPTYVAANPYQGIPAPTEFLDPEGLVRAQAIEIANAVLAKEQVLTATIGTMDYPAGGGWMVGVPLKPGVRMRLPNGREHEVQAFNIALIANPLRAQFDLERASFRAAEIGFGSSQTQYGDLLLTIVETEDTPVSAQVRLRERSGDVQSYDLTGGRTPGPPTASDETMRFLVGRSQRLVD